MVFQGCSIGVVRVFYGNFIGVSEVIIIFGCLMMNGGIMIPRYFSVCFKVV